LESNQEKDFDETSFFQKDFADFAQDEKIDIASEMDNDIAFEEEPQLSQEENLAQEEPKENIDEPIETEEKEKTIQEEIQQAPSQAPSPWDDFEQENSAVKKYIFYVSKDFVPYIDSLTTDERSAYINDAIQKKIDFEIQEKKKNTKKRITLHFIIMIMTFILAAPIVMWVCHKAVMATFDNYKYSQENFEKLYKQRFSKDKAYMRSLQYNKEQKSKTKNNP